MKKTEKLTVLITGAAAGIGNAVAKEFLKNGHTVYALDVRLPKIGEPLQADITNETALYEIFLDLREKNVVLDGIFNFAGVQNQTAYGDQRLRGDARQ